MLLRIFKVFAALVTLATAVLIGLVAAAFWRPELVINATSVRAVALLGAVKNVHVRWNELHVEATSHEFWQKSIALSFEQLCLDAPFYKIAACLPEVQLAMTVDLEPSRFGITSIGPTLLVADDLFVGPLPPSPEPSDPVDWTQIHRPKWLRQTVLHPAQIRIRHASLQVQGMHVEGGLSLDMQAPAPDPLATSGQVSTALTLKAIGLCLREGPVALDGCLDEGEATVRIGLVNEVFALTQLGPVDLKARSLQLKDVGKEVAPMPAAPAKLAAIDLTPSAAAVGDASVLRTGWSVPPLLRTLRLMPLSIAVETWQVQQAGVAASGHLELHVKPNAPHVLATLDLGKACVDAPASGAHVCFKALRAQAQAEQDSSGTLRLTMIGPVQATGGEVVYKAPLASSPAPAAAAAPSATLDPTGSLVPLWLQQAKLAPVHLQVERFDAVQGAARYQGRLNIEGKSQGNGALWRLEAASKGLGEAPVRDVKVGLSLHSAKGHFSGPWQLRSNLDAMLAPTGEARIHAETNDLGAGRLSYLISGVLSREGERIVGQVKGNLDSQGLSAAINGSASGTTPNIRSVNLSDCGLKLTWPHVWPAPGNLNMDCHVQVVPKRFPIQDELPLDWPNAVDFQWSATAQAPLPPQAAAPLKGHVQINMMPLKAAQMTATASLGADITGSLAQLPDSLQVAVAMHSQIEMQKFEALVKSLGQTKYAVPAPLNVLTGTVVVKADAAGDVMHEGLTTTLSLVTRLKSGEREQDDDQRLDTDVAGTFTIAPFDKDRAPQLKVDAKLSDIQLALPRITLSDSKAPQLLPDKRIRPVKQPSPGDKRPLVQDSAFVGPPRPDAAKTLVYSADILTPEGKPLHLLSNLAKSPIPIHIAFKATSGAPAQGSVAVREFPLNLFRRKAYVDKLEVNLVAPEASPRIDGKLRVEYTDYTITITVLGTIKAPEIKLSSQPPRPENQLIAVLLFGREMSELDDDQLKSVDNFGGAAADGALSLASMYLLASTPVQSVGYDAQSKAFTAKVIIGKGTSLNVGSDMGDYQKVGVRHRLAREWAVETYVERDSATEEEAVTALLEWSRRF